MIDRFATDPPVEQSLTGLIPSRPTKLLGPERTGILRKVC